MNTQNSLPVRKHQPLVKVTCAHCKKDIIKQHCRLKSDAGGLKKKLFCDRACVDAYQQNKGKLANVTKEQVQEMLKTMSLRAVGKALGVAHSSLQSKFKL